MPSFKSVIKLSSNCPECEIQSFTDCRCHKNSTFLVCFSKDTEVNFPCETIMQS